MKTPEHPSRVYHVWDDDNTRLDRWTYSQRAALRFARFLARKYGVVFHVTEYTERFDRDGFIETDPRSDVHVATFTPEEPTR